jgi:predicted nucleotidyltransferase
MNKMILKTLVGSRAHGLETPTSDYDYRGVFIAPTSEILKLGGKADQVSWNEGDTDDTAYELNKFLFMALKSNATVLEVLHGPVMESTPWGEELKSLFPYMWTSKGVLEAFRGYSINQRKKFLEDKDNRPWKYAVAYIRVLLLGIELLKHDSLTINVQKQFEIMPDYLDSNLNIHYDEEFNYAKALRALKSGEYSKGMVIDWAQHLEGELVKAYETNPNHTNDPDKLNEFLLRARKAHWD